VQAVWALVVGLQLSLSSLTLGHWTALCIHRWLLRENRTENTSSPRRAEPHREPRDRQGQPPGPLMNGGTPHDQQPGQQSAPSPRAGSSRHGRMQQPNGGIQLVVIEPAAAHAASHTPHAAPTGQHRVQIAADLRTRKGQPVAAERSSGGAQSWHGSERRWSLEEVEEGLPGSGVMDEEEREDAVEEKIVSGAVPWCDGVASHAICSSRGVNVSGPYHNMFQHLVSRDCRSVTCCTHISKYGFQTRCHQHEFMPGCRRQPLESKTDASVAVALVALTALWIALAVVDTGRSHVRRRSYWFSLLIGALRIDSQCHHYLPRYQV